MLRPCFDYLIEHGTHPFKQTTATYLMGCVYCPHAWLWWTANRDGVREKGSGKARSLLVWIAALLHDRVPSNGMQRRRK